MAFRRTVGRLGGGGNKSMFADKRRVIHPMNSTPSAPSSAVRLAFTTDPMKESDKTQFFSDGDMKREALDVPERLEGGRSRAALEKASDPEFDALVNFVRGARYDQMISGRRFQSVYDAMTDNDDIFVWLCMTSMAVLNPGDVRSRLIYRHLEALAQAVASGEMSARTAFRFYESAVRSPGYRAMAEQQTENGAATRLAGLCAAADVMRKMGVTRRPMTSYFELYQRITERSEAMTPWGFPPLFQFEERMQLEDRLKFFGRGQRELLRRSGSAKVRARHTRFFKHRIFWVPPTWLNNKKWAGRGYNPYPGVLPD